jgi:NitT/TauT family transport system substrate-binding protein
MNKRTTRAVGIVAGLVISAVALTACSATSTTPTATPTKAAGKVTGSIVVGTGPALSNADITAGIADGTYSKAGLTVTTTTITAASTAIPLLLNGQMNFAEIDMATAIQAVQQNVGIVIVAPNTTGNPNKVGYAGLVTNNPDIKSLKDLAGKKIQVNQIGGTAEIVAKATLAHAGVDYSGITWVEIGSPQALPALQAHQVDAAFLSEPGLTQAMSMPGYTDLGNPEQYTVKASPTFVLAASAAYVKANKALVDEFANTVLAYHKKLNANPDLIRTSPPAANVPAALLSKMTLPLFGEKPVTPADVQNFENLQIKYGTLTKATAPKPSSLFYNGK